MIAIYGLFVSDRCVYVGRTGNPAARESGHRKSTMRNQEFAMRIFKWVDPDLAAPAEREMIQEWRAKGMAELNRNGVENNRQVNARIPKASHDLLDECIKRSGLSRSKLLSILLQQSIEQLHQSQTTNA